MVPLRDHCSFLNNIRRVCFSEVFIRSMLVSRKACEEKRTRTYFHSKTNQGKQKEIKRLVEWRQFFVQYCLIYIHEYRPARTRFRARASVFVHMFEHIASFIEHTFSVFSIFLSILCINLNK